MSANARFKCEATYLKVSFSDATTTNLETCFGILKQMPL